MTDCTCHSHSGFLTKAGYAFVAQQKADSERLFLDGVDPSEDQLYLDKVVSVSASSLSVLHWDDALIEDQYRRFLNGS